jgi:sulfite exporter TauE/SafE
LSDLLNNLDHYPFYVIPFVAIIIGLLTSVHCVGMCGGLILAFTKNRKQNFSYQVGRLLGYLTIVVILSFVGINLNRYSQNLSLIMAIFIGLIFIYSGVVSHIHLHFPFQNFTQKLTQKLFHFLDSVNPLLKSFAVGFMSLFLPCGPLYAMVISLAIIGNKYVSVLGIIGFWVGTVPLLFFTPEVVEKIFKPIKNKIPRLSSLTLVLIGMSTIGYRIYLIYNPDCPLCH